MFAQLIVTVLLTWLTAEVLCRALLGRSLRGAARRALGLTDRDADTNRLGRLLRRRQRELESARQRLELTSEATDVSSELAAVEEELSDLEQRLAKIEESRAVHRTGFP